MKQLMEEFERGCQAGSLLLQRCRACGRLSCPPQAGCPHCGGGEWDWLPASGRARLWSWVSMRRAYHPAWRPRLPYTVILAELAEGPIIVSGLRGGGGDNDGGGDNGGGDGDNIDGGEPVIGQELRLVFADGLPYFTPVSPSPDDGGGE